MRDTPKEIMDLQRKIIMSKSLAERFMMTIDMYETSKAFVRSSVINQKPEISETDLKIEVFKRFYKNDFSKEDLDKIIQHLRKVY